MSDIKKLKYFAGGQWIESKSDKYMNVMNPSTGDVIAKTPCCTVEEVNYAVECAKKAYKIWSNTPVTKRVQVLYNLHSLLEKHLEELSQLVATEGGKALDDARGDVLKAIEATEVAISTPSLMMGESLRDTSNGIDTVMFKESLGVFAGIVPFNFPAMIPMGWMAPICFATGNTFVLKAASMVPMTAMRFAELYQQAGLPDGVLNIVTCNRNEAETLLSHPDIKGVSFVGSSKVGSKIYATAASNGKRVQALCEAKNHGLVLEDAIIERAAAGIINASFGCAGERCMALPVVVVQESIADKLVAEIVKKAKELKVGVAYEKGIDMGPVISAEHKKSVIDWIQKGISQGATVALDGRDFVLEGHEKGFYIGPTILDNVTPDMSVGDIEIFGPVLCIKRVKDFEEGISIMNHNPLANGSVIYTQSGYYAREFSKRTDAGMVGINIGIPVPLAMFPFAGHKNSFLGDQHCLGKDGIRFYTESKCVTTRFFHPETTENQKVDRWDGTR